MDVDPRLEPALRASAECNTPVPVGTGAPAPPLSAGGGGSPNIPELAAAGGAPRSAHGTPTGAAAPPRLASPKTQRRIAKHDKRAEGDVSQDTGEDEKEMEMCMALTRSTSSNNNVAEGAAGGGAGSAPPPTAADAAASAAGTDAPSQRALFRHNALPHSAAAQPPRRGGAVPVPDLAGLRPPDLSATAAAAGRRPEPVHHPPAAA